MNLLQKHPNALYANEKHSHETRKTETNRKISKKNLSYSKQNLPKELLGVEEIASDSTVLLSLREAGNFLLEIASRKSTKTKIEKVKKCPYNIC